MSRVKTSGRHSDSGEWKFFTKFLEGVLDRGWRGVMTSRDDAVRKILVLQLTPLQVLKSGSYLKKFFGSSAVLRCSERSGSIHNCHCVIRLCCHGSLVLRHGFTGATCCTTQWKSLAKYKEEESVVVEHVCVVGVQVSGPHVESLRVRQPALLPAYRDAREEMAGTNSGSRCTAFRNRPSATSFFPRFLWKEETTQG
ncbi:hypothetical protein CEXT_249291 [Caerostris extrusa]|uniref:Uncharacterized protein n=1 Tax=Caerostris extrusa TaxID=172846 RepID=A0AAV4SHH1_CAEEX|nr:hypothetical protein CEXT_249291 [Caerostris extrusa]